MNLSGVTYWTPQWVFVDAFKQAREWIPIQDDVWNSGTLDLDENGWPRSLAPNQEAGTLIFRDISGRYPVGDYTFLYDGEGEVKFNYNTTVVSQQPGRTVVRVNSAADAGFYIKIVSTNPANPIRNFRFIMPGFEASYREQPFHPLFLERLRSYSLLRFMNFLRTNNQTMSEWRDRSTPDYYTQASSKGVALEYIIQLSNLLHKDAWLNIPHAASDDYVRQFAAMVRDRLDPGLKIYVEYSNEAWNTIFTQASYCRDQGLALGLSTNSTYARLRFISRRAVEIFNIWYEVFGNQASSRLVRVLAGQRVNPWLGEQIMDWNNAKDHADAFAIAQYFGGKFGTESYGETTKTWTVDQLLDGMSEDIDINFSYYQGNYQKAAARGLALISYEGGPALVGAGVYKNDPVILSLFFAANRHPRMKDLVIKNINTWKNAGGRIYTHFASTDICRNSGSWGALEYQDQDPETAPKFQALEEFIQTTPRWWPE